MPLLLAAVGCRCELGSETDVFGQDLAESQAMEQEGWRLGDSTSFYPRHERGGRKFWFLAKEWRIFQISQEGGGAGRGVGALTIYTFTRGGHRVSKDAPRISLPLLLSRSRTDRESQGSALDCSLPLSPQHCLQEAQ